MSDTRPELRIGDQLIGIFDECSVPAAEAADYANRLAKEGEVSTIFILDESQPYAAEAHVYSLAARQQTDSGRPFEYVLYKCTPQSEEDLNPAYLGARVRNDVVLPLAMFARRDNEQCDYVQIGQEMKNEAIVATGNDQGTRKEIVVALRDMLQAEQQYYEQKANIYFSGDLRDKVSTDLYLTLCRSITDGFEDRHAGVFAGGFDRTKTMLSLSQYIASTLSRVESFIQTHSDPRKLVSEEDGELVALIEAGAALLRRHSDGPSKFTRNYYYQKTVGGSARSIRKRYAAAQSAYGQFFTFIEDPLKALKTIQAKELPATGRYEQAVDLLSAMVILTVPSVLNPMIQQESKHYEKYYHKGSHVPAKGKDDEAIMLPEALEIESRLTEYLGPASPDLEKIIDQTRDIDAPTTKESIHPRQAIGEEIGDLAVRVLIEPSKAIVTARELLVFAKPRSLDTAFRPVAHAVADRAGLSKAEHISWEELNYYLKVGSLIVPSEVTQ